jgi:hypothetical protein
MVGKLGRASQQEFSQTGKAKMAQLDKWNDPK